MRKNGVQKIPGMTTIRVDGALHIFYMDDKFHPMRKEIITKWKELGEKLAQAG